MISTINSIEFSLQFSSIQFFNTPSFICFQWYALLTFVLNVCGGISLNWHSVKYDLLFLIFIVFCPNSKKNVGITKTKPSWLSSRYLLPTSFKQVHSCIILLVPFMGAYVYLMHPSLPRMRWPGEKKHTGRP